MSLFTRRRPIGLLREQPGQLQSMTADLLERQIKLTSVECSLTSACGFCGARFTKRRQNHVQSLTPRRT